MIGDIREITPRQAQEFLLPRHYSGRKANIQKAFGWYVDGVLKAVCSFGKPANNNLCYGICGREFSSSVYELNRLCREDDFDQPMSQMVGYCLRKLRPLNWIIVSYSDTAMGHHGYIYQACNFIYTGCTKKRTEIYTGEGKHSRHYTQQDHDCGVRKVRSPKHRYVYFCTNSKEQRNRWLKSLNYSVLPYPKGDNKENYELGNYLQPQLVMTRD